MSVVQAIAIDVLVALDEQTDRRRSSELVRAAILSARPNDVARLFPEYLSPAETDADIDAYIDGGGVVEGTVEARDAMEIMKSIGLDGVVDVLDLIANG